MKIKLVLVDKAELHKGEEEEHSEHGFDKELSQSVAAQHLDKKDPHYYTKADAAGLEEYKNGLDSNKGTGGDSSHAQSIPTGKKFPFDKKSTGRLGPIKKAAKKGPVYAVPGGFGPK